MMHSMAWIAANDEDERAHRTRIERPPTMLTKFVVNGRPAAFEGPEDVPLLWVIREHLSLTGSKFGCGIGACGACTMLVDGSPTRTCILQIVLVQNKHITTIEGLSANGDHPVQKAWTELDVPQCGYCQSGMIMAAAGLLREHPNPTDQDIDRKMTNLCRCATYVRIRAAIHLAAKLGSGRE
jgi:isoquinoline 1-oxidoreductase alpha subunit